MEVSALSGNDLFCLTLKGISPGDLAVGNSVRSLGVGGSIRSSFGSLAGGEIADITRLISEGRHAAMARMTAEARRHGASGVIAVVSEIKTLAGYTEFLAQGTTVRFADNTKFFSAAVSGTELFCHLDAGYAPVSFVMGNVAYALGIGRGLTGGLRTLARGEVKEYSDLYNDIRHLALKRIEQEALQLGANAVVDVRTELMPFMPGVVELVMTGTASYHAGIPQGSIVSSELRGDELWSLATMGYAPLKLVMATSVCSLGVAAGIGTLFQSISRGGLERLRHEGEMIGAERVMGNRLVIRELSRGLIEIVAIGTAVRRADPSFQPATPSLPVQAVTVGQSSLQMKTDAPGIVRPAQMASSANRAAVVLRLAVIVMVIVMSLITSLMARSSRSSHPHRGTPAAVTT
ncbi:MAG TPA: heavy metal-binding domain-containing protein [Polyangiaceae bacterium]|jgi:uncharacterized protein YbjQ (UPF0145 family)|nr:heavy metal-binding domain-containing protein [Polyangiaceae bacterium]